MLGQLMLETVATQAALNSDWDTWDGWDDWDEDGKDDWDCGWDGWDWDGDAGCCPASAIDVVFLDEEHALTRTISR